MADLTNIESRRGAVDALSALLQAKMRPLRKTDGFESPEEMDKKAEQDKQQQKQQKGQDNQNQSNKSDNQSQQSDNQSSNSQPNNDLSDPNRANDDPTHDKVDSQSQSQNQQKANDEPEYNKYGMKLPKNVKPIEDDIDEDPNDPDYESPEDHQRRLDRVKDELNDDELNQTTLDQIKQKTQANRDKVARAKADEMKRIAAETKAQNEWMNLGDLTADIVKAIGSQIKVRNRPEDSYLRPNATYAGSGFIMPGQKNLEHRDLPVINIYFDKSGSVPRSGLQRAKEAMKELYTLERRKLVKYHIYYFASEIADEDNKPCGSGTTAFPKILEHLQATKATNAIIITDSDFERQTDFNTISPIELKGKVWWLWHNGNRSATAFSYLKARMGRAQFRFS